MLITKGLGVYTSNTGPVVYVASTSPNVVTDNIIDVVLMSHDVLPVLGAQDLSFKPIPVINSNPVITTQSVRELKPTIQSNLDLPKF